MDREVLEGKPCTWVGAFVYSRENDENIFIGALRFPGENLVLASKLASFVEIYGQLIPVEQIPKLTVLVTLPPTWPSTLTKSRVRSFSRMTSSGNPAESGSTSPSSKG